MRLTNRLGRLLRLKNLSVQQYKYSTKSLVNEILISFHFLIRATKRCTNWKNYVDRIKISSV